MDNTLLDAPPMMTTMLVCPLLVAKLDKQLFDYDGIIHHRTENGNAGYKHYFYDSTIATVDDSLNVQTKLSNIN